MPTKSLDKYSKSDQETMKRFGARVRELREEAGLSQEKLGENTDLHRTYISGLERGCQNISLLTMTKLAGTLSVSVGDLVSDI